MSRFTDPNKWHKDKWFRRLKPLQKLIFLYLIDNCDIAGFWEKDFDMMAYSIGVSDEEIKKAYKGIDKGLVDVDGWIWIQKFIKHQKNLPLNPKNNAHKGIIRILKSQRKRFKKSELFNQFLLDQGIEIQKTYEKEGAKEGLNSPTGKGRGKGNVSNKDKEVLPLPEKIQQAETVHALSKIWFGVLQEKNQWPTLSQQEMIQFKMKSWGLSTSKKIVSAAAQNGWKSLKADYIKEQENNSNFATDAVHL